MNNNIKQISFVVLGLAIITAIFTFSKLNSATAAKKNGKKFGDWVVSCIDANKENKTPEICLLIQSVNITKDDKTEKFASFQLGYFGDKKELKMIQILPLGVSLLSGTSIISSTKLIAPGKYTHCLQDGCQALAPISNEDLALLKSEAELSVGVIRLEGQQINIPFSTKGIEAGLKFIK